jgi:hypothetical protein
MVSTHVEIIGYVGSIGLEALFKPPERISDAVRFRWDRNGIRIQPVSTSGTHSGYSNRYKNCQKASSSTSGGDTNGNLHTQNSTDRKHVGSGSELHKHVGSGSENFTYKKEPLDSLVRLEDDRDEGFIKVERRTKGTRTKLRSGS